MAGIVILAAVVLILTISEVENFEIIDDGMIS